MNNMQCLSFLPGISFFTVLVSLNYCMNKLSFQDESGGNCLSVKKCNTIVPYKRLDTVKCENELNISDFIFSTNVLNDVFAKQNATTLNSALTSILYLKPKISSTNIILSDICSF